MRTCTFKFVHGQGWSSHAPADLDSEQSLVLAFAASRFIDDPEPLQQLRAWFPRSHVLGCSTAGEILNDRVSDETIAVAVIRFDRTRLRTAVTAVEGQVAPLARAQESFTAGQQLARALEDPDLRGVFVLSDGGVVNGSELVRGINDILPSSVVVTGGLAGDGDRFQRTWVLADGRPAERRISAVGLYGDAVRIGHGSKGGWDQFGPERVITRSQGNVLFELDNRPALQLYKEYLGERVAGLPATALLFPLAVRSPGQVHSCVRTILDIDETSQSMVFAGDVATGSLAQLMRANFDRLVQGASDAASMVSIDQFSGPTLSIAISCVGRRLVLRQRIEEELEAAIEVLPAGTRQIGFYSYGELSPHTDGTCELHNQTMTLTILGEA